MMILIEELEVFHPKVRHAKWKLWIAAMGHIAETSVEKNQLKDPSEAMLKMGCTNMKLDEL